MRRFWQHCPMRRDARFSWARRADASVVVSYDGSAVTTLRGSAAARFLERVDGADEAAAQQLMARVTGNFKRGNERDGKLRR